MGELTDKAQEIVDLGNESIIIMMRLLSLDYKLLFYIDKIRALDYVDVCLSKRLVALAKICSDNGNIEKECNILNTFIDEYTSRLLPLFEAWKVGTSILSNVTTVPTQKTEPGFESLINIIIQSSDSDYITRHRVFKAIVKQFYDILVERSNLLENLEELLIDIEDPRKARIIRNSVFFTIRCVDECNDIYRQVSSDIDMLLCNAGPDCFYDNGTVSHSKTGSETSDSEFKLSTVDFSVVAPNRISINASSVIDIFAYGDGYRHIIDKALETENAIEKPMGQSHVKTKAKITMVLSSEGLIIDDNKAERIWEGGYLRFSFLIRVRKNFQENKIPVSATVFIDNVVATQIQFLIDRSSSVQEGTGISVYRKDIMSVFMSYASRDRNRVISIIQGMKKVRPEINIFFDIDNLRSGEHWQSVIQREIDTHDYLMLCWSRYAKESQWVDKEWRYAYETKGEEYIEPIPLENPVYCPPPLELANKHFNDKYIMFAKEEDRYVYCEEKLGRLKHLHDMQLISLEDYNALKKSVLSEFF